MVAECDLNVACCGIVHDGIDDLLDKFDTLGLMQNCPKRVELGESLAQVRGVDRLRSQGGELVPEFTEPGVDLHDGGLGLTKAL